MFSPQSKRARTGVSKHPLTEAKNVLIYGPWACLETEKLSSRAKDTVRNELTLQPFVFSPTAQTQPQSIHAFTTMNRGKYLCVPRAYYKKHCRPVEEHESYRVQLGPHEAVQDTLSFHGDLRNEDQRRFVRNLSSFLQRQGPSGGAVALGSGEPGCGKTACFLYLWVNVLRLKALVIVRGLPIVSQWGYAVKKFVPEARVGIIHQNTWEIQGRDIVIASADTLAARAERFHPRLWNCFGVVCFDEAHHLVASTLIRVHNRCMRARYCISLTGTPDRKDGLTKELGYYTGPNVAFMKNKEVVHVHRLVFAGGQQNVSEYHYGPMKGKYNSARMLNDLSEDGRRTSYLIDLLTQCIFAGRKVLVLSSRCSLRETLENLLLENIRSWQGQGRALPDAARPTHPPLKITGPKLTASDQRVKRYRKALDDLYLKTHQTTQISEGSHEDEITKVRNKLEELRSKMKPEEIQKADNHLGPENTIIPAIGPDHTQEPIPIPFVGVLRAQDKAIDREWKYKSRVVIATYDMAREALDIPGLDTLMFATPAVDVRQAIGRIRRGTAQTLETTERQEYISPWLYKACGIVIDIVDPFASFGSWSEKRRRFYESERDYIKMIS